MAVGDAVVGAAVVGVMVGAAVVGEDVGEAVVGSGVLLDLLMLLLFFVLLLELSDLEPLRAIASRFNHSDINCCRTKLLGSALTCTGAAAKTSAQRAPIRVTMVVHFQTYKNGSHPIDRFSGLYEESRSSLKYHNFVNLYL